MKRTTLSERGLVLAPRGRDAALAAGILMEGGITAQCCAGLPDLIAGLNDGAGFVVVTEEALATSDLQPLASWLEGQEEWSDLPFILLTSRGGGIERNPAAVRYLHVLGNVTFIERPFHPTTLMSVAQSALRGRRRQYEARARLEILATNQKALQQANETLEQRVEDRTQERETALAQLHEVQKLETLGQLTGGVAHDFNNLLTPIIGSLDLLRRRMPAEDKSQRQIDLALQAAGRAATLVQRLLAFARRQDLQPRPTDVVELLRGMEDLIVRSIGPMVEMSIDCPDELPPALVDPNQLELAVLNLAINARDAMSGGGKLAIAASSHETDGASGLAAGNYVCLSISDTGVGMDAATLAHAIEPFFSTKGLGRGTGLGLSMVHGLAAQLGGKLQLRSSPGKGTTAEIWLPVSRQPAGKLTVAHPPLVAASGPATILLVDDEDIVRAATAEMLEDLGYRVLQANSGAQALHCLREGKQADLLITDYLMPGMNGVDLSGHVRRLAPDLPVLLITGYSTISEGRGAELPRLTKPFRHGDLARKVSEVLEVGRSGAIDLAAERAKR